MDDNERYDNVEMNKKIKKGRKLCKCFYNSEKKRKTC